MTELLLEYRRKRDFTKTLEPSGQPASKKDNAPLYVMHKHAASHDHFDLRLEQDGVLRSWAVPKGPSLKPGEKRLAVEVEDHPVDYATFEGVIPKGQYGGGTVMLWDAGHWKSSGKQSKDKVDFELDGSKLKGRWTLVRTRNNKGKHWLLIKRNDSPAKALNPDDKSVVSGRTMEQIAKDHDNTWIKGKAIPDKEKKETKKTAKKQASRLTTEFHVDLDAYPDASAEPMPAFIQPQLATLTDRAPQGDNWLHEVKFDGYRLIARIEAKKCQLFTRNENDWTDRFPELIEQLQQLPVKNAIIDGEVVAYERNGVTSFPKLQDILSKKSSRSRSPLFFQMFDILYLNDYDLTRLPLLDRKNILAELFAAADITHSEGALINYSEHIQSLGKEFYDEACRTSLEGIISKRADTPYISGRTTHWLKVKCTKQDEFVIGGFTPPKGSRKRFGSLLLGAYVESTDKGKKGAKEFVYCGRTGTGFNARTIEQLYKQLKPLQRKTSPFNSAVPNQAGAHWVKPSIVVDVEFTERTESGVLRHPVFRGVREDRKASEIFVHPEIDQPPSPEELHALEWQEQASSTDKNTSQSKATGSKTRAAKETSDSTDHKKEKFAGVKLTNPDRVLYQQLGATKQDLAQYYEDIQHWILPYVAFRPLSLVRCPEGLQAQCFFQKHPHSSALKPLPSINITEKSQKTARYVYIRSLRDLIVLVQNGVLEIHPWGSLVDDVEHPDSIVFDLDPGPGVPWEIMIDSVKQMRERLTELGLTGFLRTTGGKGLHVVVPIVPKNSWEEIKSLAKAISEAHASDDPKRHTTNMSKEKRKGRIFLDYLRNGRGSTAIGSYSLRAREGAPVATPIQWEELNKDLHSDYYTLTNIRRRLGSLKSDPWDGFIESCGTITASLKRKVGLGK